MIDLHLHTTASDGALSPADLVVLAKASGLSTIAVTDHDTMSAVPELQELSREAELTLVPGIEMTSVWHGRDIHVLGYFLDWRSPRMTEFFAARSGERVGRARRIGERLRRLGAPLDIDALVEEAAGRAIGRPDIARALVEAGHVPSVQEAFDRFLADGAPAAVMHVAETPHEVVALIDAQGGIASFAHPGVTKQDGLLEELAGAGLHAVEVYHPDHSAEDTARYLALARAHGLLVTGGSDFHGEDGHRAVALGDVTLPAREFDRLCTKRRTTGGAHASSPQTRPVGRDR